MGWQLGLVHRINCLAPYFKPLGRSDYAIWDSRRYIVVNHGGPGSNGISLSSNYGQTWVTHTPPFEVGESIGSNGYRLVSYNGDGFPTDIYVSDDNGATWTSRGNTEGSFNFPGYYNTANYQAIASDGTGFVMVGNASGSFNNVYYSADGTTWSGIRLGGAGVVYWHSLQYFNGAYYMLGGPVGGLQLRKSVDGGATWSSLTPPLGGAPIGLFPFMWVGDGKLVVKTKMLEGDACRLWSSSDGGGSWTEHSLSGIDDITYLGWNGEQWIATGLNAALSYMHYRGDDLDSLAVNVTTPANNCDWSATTSSGPRNYITGWDSVDGSDGLWVINPDCDDPPYGIPFIFYNTEMVTSGDNLFTNDGTEGDIHDTVRGDLTPFRWYFVNENEDNVGDVNTGGPYPQYQEDFGDTNFESGSPVTVIFAFDTPGPGTDGELYVFTQHYIYGWDWDGFLMYSELDVGPDYVYFDMNLWDAVFPGKVNYESSLYIESDWFTSLLLPTGRNVIGITVYPEPTNGTNYAIFNGTHSDDFPADPPPSPYTYMFSGIYQEAGFTEEVRNGSAYHGTAEYPAPFSVSWIEIEGYSGGVRVKNDAIKAVAFTRKPVTAADIEFWKNVDLTSRPSFI